MLRELMSLPHANATTSPCAFERTATVGAYDRAETRANSIEREPKKCVEGQRIQIPEMLVAPQREKGPAFALHAKERRGRDVERLHFPPRTPPSTKRPLPITKLDSSDA